MEKKVTWTSGTSSHASEAWQWRWERSGSHRDFIGGGSNSPLSNRHRDTDDTSSLGGSR